MTYELRRDTYMEHVRWCTQCLTTFTSKRKLFADDRGCYLSHYATISSICPVARKLLDEVI